MASIENSEGGMPRPSGVANLIVKGAIALVTGAFFIGAYLQFQVGFWLALIVALSVYIALIMLHALMRRREREGVLVSELSRLEDEVARLKTAQPQAVGMRRERPPAFPPNAHPTDPSAPPMMPAATRAPVGPTAPVAPPPAPPAANIPMPPPAPPRPPRIFRDTPAPANEPSPGLMAHRPGAVMSDAHRPEPMLSVPTATSAEELQPGPRLPDWSTPPKPSAAPGNHMHDYWPGRNAKPSLPEAPRVEPPAERETDLDAVHGMIKRLAEEVNVGADQLDGLPPPRQESVLRASLNALQTTANAMRATKKVGGLPFSGTPRAGAPVPPPIMPSHTRLASLADAVAAGRIDAMLSPIVGLADHQIHYYEVVACPRDERGTPLPATTRDPQLALAGLLPMLDSARLRQAARVASTFAVEGRETCLFAPATAVSLANDSFLDELADAYRDREALASELVLTFAQADIRTFGGSEWSALTDMRDLGFRFCIEDVTDFDYEFTALCAAGFAFVKLDAGTLLAGLAAPSGTMGADEVCRNLGELGLTLIVGNIDDEAMRARVLEAGVPLGQGGLFGAPVAAPGGDFSAADHAAA